MKLITWNCARGFDKKKQYFFSTSPDIAVIQECSKKSTASPAFDGYKALWADGNPRIGMGLFYKENWSVRHLVDTPSGIEWVVPFEVTGPETFTLIAVWACQIKGNKRQSYVGQIHQALEKHPEWFQRGPTVMMGDFNSNACFDRGRRDWNHTEMVEQLGTHDLVSAYHALENKEHGIEEIPTFYLHKNPTVKEKRFHFDYVFIPKDWQARTAISVGAYPEWRPYSDHCPVTVEIS